MKPLLHKLQYRKGGKQVIDALNSQYLKQGKM